MLPEASASEGGAEERAVCLDGRTELVHVIKVSLNGVEFLISVKTATYSHDIILKETLIITFPTGETI